MQPLWTWLSTALLFYAPYIAWVTSQRVVAITTTVYAFVSIRMLFVIRTQAKAAKDAAEAAKRNADALINSERAWLLVDIQITKNSVKQKIMSIHLVVKCRNDGRSPAWLTEWRVGFSIVDTIPSLPGLSSLENIIALEALGSRHKPITLEADRSTEGQLSFDNHAIVYGIVIYRDVFGKTRETTFGYEFSYIPTDAEPVVILLPNREWNKYT